MPRKTKEISNKKDTLTKKVKNTSKIQKKSKKEHKTILDNIESTLSNKKTISSSNKNVSDKKDSEVKIKLKNTKINSSSKKNTVKKTKIRKYRTDTTPIKKEPKIFTPEYYDLPYRYNQTVVKILAQTPSSLFIYWDISDEDRQNLQKAYGEHIFEITKPVLIVHNLTMKYSFEVDINDFANSWYLHINDSKCEYNIELGRRPIPINYSYINNYNKDSEDIRPIEVPYIYISSSNKIESPNDKILFNKEQPKIYFRNVKTNEVIAKDISEFVFISNIGRFYNLSEIYQKFYREDEIINSNFILRKPGFGNPSSDSLSSKFK